MTDSLLFSVIIPTYHRNDLLAKCLSRLASSNQTLPQDFYEIVVTDDGSSPTTEALIQSHYPWVRWVAGPCSGPAANRNNGARSAQGKWLVFLDDDCVPDTQWLEAYAEAIKQQSEFLVFEGRVYVDRPRQSLAEKSPTNETGGYLWSCNLAVKKNLFEKLNGFNEEFPYAAMEDCDFRLRVQKAGYEFCFVSQASVCHPWRTSGGWKELKRHQISTFIYLHNHPDQLSKINSSYYLWLAGRGFIKNTLPGLFLFRCKGCRMALLEHLSYLQMSILLILNSRAIKEKTYL